MSVTGWLKFGTLAAAPGEMASGAVTDGDPLVVDDDPLVELHAANMTHGASRMTSDNRVQRTFMTLSPDVQKSAAREEKRYRNERSKSMIMNDKKDFFIEFFRN